jgi:hypothetical protein
MQEGREFTTQLELARTFEGDVDAVSERSLDRTAKDRNSSGSKRPPSRGDCRQDRQGDNNGLNA